MTRVPFAQVRYFTIEIGAGNPGATAVLWQVAQQTALRNVTILAGARGNSPFFVRCVRPLLLPASLQGMPPWVWTWRPQSTSTGTDGAACLHRTISGEAASSPTSP